jgi:hypothetical protein
MLRPRRGRGRGRRAGIEGSDGGCWAVAWYAAGTPGFERVGNSMGTAAQTESGSMREPAHAERSASGNICIMILNQM